MKNSRIPLLKGLKVLELHEIDDIDRQKMRNLARLLVKIAKRLRAEELEREKEINKAACVKVS